MSDKLVEIAAYSLPVEAHVAHGLLEADGIRAVLCGDQTVNVVGIQGIAGKITLHVAESDAARATALLAEIEDGPPPDDSGLWLCPLCGDAVPIDAAACPACQTPRPETWQVRTAMSSPQNNADSEEIQREPPRLRSTVTSDTPIEAVPWAREEEEGEDQPIRNSSIVGDRRTFNIGWLLVAALIAVLAGGLLLLAWPVLSALLGWRR